MRRKRPEILPFEGQTGEEIGIAAALFVDAENRVRVDAAHAKRGRARHSAGKHNGPGLPRSRNRTLRAAPISKRSLDV